MVELDALFWIVILFFQSPSPASPSFCSEMYASEAEMMKNQVPLAWRDYCAHLLIPLNRCRVDNMYLPWTCQEQKHAYEKCEYEESDNKTSQAR